MSPVAQEALEALAGGALRDSPQAAWELFEGAWPLVEQRVGVFLRSLRVSQEFREDCGQDALLRVWRSRESYRGTTVDELFAWIYRITKHEAIRLGERRGRSAVREADGDQRISLEERAVGLAEDGTARRTEADDDARALEECLDGLDERARTLVELLYGPQAATERAVAMMMDISKSYVNRLRQQALESLNHCLQGKGLGA